MWSKSTSKARMRKKSNQTIQRNQTQKNKNTPIANTTHNQYGTATIFDLQQQDKDKIGNLIRKVVELDTKHKSTQQKAKKTQSKLKKQLTALKSQNNQIILQHTKLRTKFQQSLKLLQNYQLKVNQMDAVKSVKMKSTPNVSIPNIEQEKYTKEIQKEINDLKQLILELHEKQQPLPNHIHSQPLRASRHSVLCEDIHSFDTDEIDEINDDVANISPIKTPKLYHQPPAPHPYPINTNTKLSLAQLRKYTLSTSSTSPKNKIKKSKPIRHLNKDRLDQLLKIQSGKFKKIEKKQKNNMYISASANDLIYNDNDRHLRRVQSEKTVQTRHDAHHYFVDSCDDDTDRLSVYESIDLGISFPETQSDYFSDQEEEDLLIQHLNVLPQ